MYGRFADDIFLFVFRFRGAIRVIVLVRQALTPSYERTLQRLVGILGIIYGHPSNPNYNRNSLLEDIFSDNMRILTCTCR